MNEVHKRRSPRSKWCTCGLRYTVKHMLTTTMHPADYIRLRGGAR